ncbi:MAG TPA: FAD-binding oxidoreductase [Nonomuraea sp.]|nr:FAD-binding oxidoreductase [Nonomuraea sp.]
MGIVEEGRLVLRTGDRGYDQARTVWNAMVNRRPQMIIRCAGVHDVVAAVRTARELDLEIGVRCGGHSVTGQAVPEGGLMIDLTLMGEVRVDPARRRAWVGGGALLGALDRAAQRHGLATTAGNVSHTGVGGLTLGGGMGWLARQYGLACDNVISFEMVTAAGQVVRASREENPDLFWGLRGGGGNFGVVTRFEFQLHPIGTQALTARYTFPIERALPVMRGWRDLSAEAPRQATFTAWAGGEKATFGFVWVGDPEEGRRLLPDLGALGRPVTEHVAETTYLDLQTRDDVADGHSLRRFWKGHYLRHLPDEAIEAFLDGSRDVPGARLQAYGGAIADVPDEDSAFGHRDTAFEYVTSVGWSDPAEDESRMTAARRAAAAVEPFASGVYVNTISDEGAHGVRRAYPPAKLARLTALKDVYDPHNVFHLNHNIRPSAEPARA